MNFCERTWEERGDALKRAYGYMWPPETVIPFSWRDRIRCPGACALPLPPIDDSRDPIRHRRSDWLKVARRVGEIKRLDPEECDRQLECASGNGTCRPSRLMHNAMHASCRSGRS